MKSYNPETSYFFLTRGIPGSGKSTFVDKYLKNISKVVESDVIRQKMKGLDEAGKISQNNGQEVWDEINRIIYSLLHTGQSITLDATNIANYLLRKYKRVADKFNYEFVIIDFSNISLEKALQQNLNRIFCKQVSNEVIEKMHRQLIKENAKLQFEVLTKEQFLDWVWIKE